MVSQAHAVVVGAEVAETFTRWLKQCGLAQGSGFEGEAYYKIETPEPQNFASERKLHDKRERERGESRSLGLRKITAAKPKRLGTQKLGDTRHMTHVFRRVYNGVNDW